MSFRPPENFDFSRPELWPTWRQRFVRYYTASKLKKEEMDIQISALIYCMGAEAEKIYSTFAMKAEEENFLNVIARFDAYFVPKVNIIHERANFHQRSQLSGENVETYVRTLYSLAERAALPDRDNAIRDRLVIGLLDRELSQKLQLCSELTLSEAISQARMYEQVKEQTMQQQQQHHQQQQQSVDFVKKSTHLEYDFNQSQNKTNRPTNARKQFQDWRQGNSNNDNHLTCGYCGRQPHANMKDCPAWGRVCRNCRKYNHFSSVCRQPTRLDSVNTSESYFLGAIGQTAKYIPQWDTTINICGMPTRFKIDTGADVSVLSSASFIKLNQRPKLTKTNATLRSPGGIVNCWGYFTTTVTVKGEQFNLQIFVIDSDTDNLLSRAAASEMGLVARLHEVSLDPFGELDTQPIKCNPVKVMLKDNAQPYSLKVPRRIPIPLMEKVKEELLRMKRNNVIEEVTEPTDWCAGIVVVKKKSGAIRICTDFKKLNMAVKRERYMIPTIEDTLHKINGSSVFSKLDATSGFWQIPLDESTAKLTTFITPFGRFFYKRLPFGISSAPEIFQRTMEDILKDHKNVVCYFDDILIYSRDKTEHERHLNALLKTLADVGLNKEKCQLRKEDIEFMGFRINKEGLNPDVSKVESIQKLADPKNTNELMRVLGMINFLSRFVPNLSTVLHPLTQLLEKDTALIWGHEKRSKMC